MKKQDKNLIIKNMVCNRCIKVVTEGLVQFNIDFIDVQLGKVILKEPLKENEKTEFEKYLNREGFELVEEKEKKIVNEIKSLIIQHIHYQTLKSENKNLSEYLSEKLYIDYSYLSRIFSELENKTIEQYAIEQKVEKVKELIVYNELTLSEISYELNYSSSQHLSRQFKQITGMTPSQFKKIKKRKKLDKI